MTGDPERRTGLLTVAAVMGVLVVWMLVVLVRRSAEPVYLFGPWRLWIAVVAVGVALLGLIGVRSTRRHDLVLHAGLTMGLLVAGVGTIFSIGIVLLILAVLAGAFLVNRLRIGSDRVAVMSGAAIGAGVLVLIWNVLQPPAVVCQAGGGASIQVGGRYSSLLTESESTGDGGSRGVARFNGGGFEYECRDGHLTRFELTP